MVLLHTVSSGILIVEPTQRNRSGCQEVDRTSVGIVTGGGQKLSDQASQHTYTCRVSQDTIHESTESCLQVSLPWLRAETQPFKILTLVGFRELHMGQRGFD